jgi:hypothetical protein
MERRVTTSCDLAVRPARGHLIASSARLPGQELASPVRVRLGPGHRDVARAQPLRQLREDACLEMTAVEALGVIPVDQAVATPSSEVKLCRRINDSGDPYPGIPPDNPCAKSLRRDLEEIPFLNS